MQPTRKTDNNSHRLLPRQGTAAAAGQMPPHP